MSLALSLKVDDATTTRTRELEAPPAMRRVNARGAAAVSRAIQNHLRTKGTNKQFPGSTTGFYGAAARSVISSFDVRGATVSIQKLGIALRYYGGTVVPRSKKYLTIPAVAAAYGKRAGEFPGLKLRIRRVDGKPRAVALEDPQGSVMFWLVKFAVQRPDPTVLPPNREMERTAARAMGRQIEREWNAPAAGGNT